MLETLMLFGSLGMFCVTCRSSTDDHPHLQAEDEVRAAAGPIQMVTRIVQTLHDAPRNARTLEGIGREILTATSATLVILEQQQWNARARVGPGGDSSGNLEFGTPELESATQAAIAAADARPTARPAADVFGPTARVLSCSSPCRRATLVVVLPRACDLAVETVWLRSLQLIINQIVTPRLSEDRSPATEPAAAGITTRAKPGASIDYSPFHRSLKLKEVAATIANDTRMQLDVDRVSVLLRSGRKYRTQAVSGCSKVHRRSNVIRALERLGRVVAPIKATFDFPGSNLSETDPIPPQIQTALDPYLDESLVDRIRIVPLFEADSRSAAEDETSPPARPPIALLVLENLADRNATAADLEIPNHPLLARHAGHAIENAQRHGRIFLLPIWETLGGLFVRGRRLWTLLVIVILASLVAAMRLVDIDHYVIARGTLQPCKRQHVFAPADGVVEKVHVQHGQSVDRDAPLVTLQSAELERRIEETLGQIQTATRQRAAILANRLANQDRAAGRKLPFDSMAGEEQQLDAQIASLKKQLALLQDQAAQLEIRSPIAGTVISWDLTSRIGSRPVVRGHQLMTIGSVEDAWMLELQLPDDDVGVVNLARQVSDHQLVVAYALATDPERLYSATLAKVAESAMENTEGRTVVPIEALLPTDTAHAKRVGAEVRAKIYCGRRSLAASWFSDVAKAFRKHVLFHFRRAES